MASFDKYVPRLKQWEGGYGNHPNDSGGPTMCGVTIATFRQFYGQDKTVADLQKMTNEQWRRIMKGGFWDKCWGDQIKSQAVAEIFVDWCINSGPGMIKKVQAILNVAQDGIVGPKTVAAINAARPKLLHFKIKSARAAWFETLVVNNPGKNMCMYDGWMARLGDFKLKE